MSQELIFDLNYAVRFQLDFILQAWMQHPTLHQLEHGRGLAPINSNQVNQVE